MPLDTKYLPLAVILAFVFICAVSLILYLASSLYRKFRSKDKEESSKEPTSEIISIKTSGEQLDNLFKYTIYLIFLEIIAFLMFFPLFVLNEDTIFMDIWPFLLIGFVIIFTLLSIIDWSKLRSKRTLQKDLRRF